MLSEEDFLKRAKAKETIRWLLLNTEYKYASAREIAQRACCSRYYVKCVLEELGMLNRPFVITSNNRQVNTTNLNRNHANQHYSSKPNV